MFKISKEELKNILEINLSIFNAEITSLNFEVWWNSLCCYNVHQIKNGLQQWINENKKPPMPSDILAILRGYSREKTKQPPKYSEDLKCSLERRFDELLGIMQTREGRLKYLDEFCKVRAALNNMEIGR